MKRFLSIVAVLLVAGVVLTPALPAEAQTMERVWDQGTVWSITLSYCVWRLNEKRWSVITAPGVVGWNVMQGDVA